MRSAGWAKDSRPMLPDRRSRVSFSRNPGELLLQ
jgi:hypothetical protein